MESIEQIRNKIRVNVGNQTKCNKRLLNKEESVLLFNQNFDHFRLNPDFQENVYHKSENYDEIIDELFSMDNVYVATTPCDDHFSKFGEWIGEYPTNTYRSLNERDIINSVKDYLDKGAVIYLYMFYMMKQDIVKDYDPETKESILDKDVNTYWWRLITKIEDKQIKKDIN